MKTKHNFTLAKFHRADFSVQRYQLAALASLFLLLALSAQAASQFFSGASANKNWDTSTLNWGVNGGPYTTAAWVNGNDAVFQGTAATVTNLGVSAHSLTFTNSGWVIASNVLTLNGSAPFIYNSNAVTVSSVIDGTAGFTKSGNAGLTLSGANTFTGRLTNNSGANVVGIIVANNDALGAGGAGNETVVVGNGGSSTVGNAIQLNPGVTTPANETLILSALTGRAALVMNAAGTATWGGNILVTNASGSFGGVQVYCNSGGILNINGNIVGTVVQGLLLRGGPGTNNINGNILLTNSPLFKADTDVVYINTTGNKWGLVNINQGTLRLGTNDALDTSAPLIINQAGASSGCTFDLNGFNQSVSSVSNSAITTAGPSVFKNGAVVPVVFTVNATNSTSQLAKNGTGDILLSGLISLVKNGAFSFTLGGANTYTGTNTINGGKLLIASATTALGNITNELDLNAGTIDLGGFSQMAGSVNVVSGAITNGTLTATNFAVQAGTIYANLAGTGTALTKTGNGTLTVGGVNTYDQPTTVTGGKLVGVTGASLNSSAVTFAPGAGVATTNGVLVTAAGSQWTCASLTNITAGGGTIYAEFNFGTVSGPSTGTAPLQVNGDADVSGTLNVIVTGGFGWIAGQTYPLVQIAGAAPASINLNLVGEPVGVSGGSVSYDAINKVINYTAGSVPQPLTWIKGSGLWDVNASTNWLNPSAILSKFQQADSVTFDDSPGAGPFIVTNNTTVNPVSVTFANNAADYTLTGSGTINSSIPFSKSTATKLTVASSNNFPGDSTVSAGTLVLASASALGSGGLTVNNATLALGNASALGTGTLNLTGATLDSTVPNLVNANNNVQTWNSDLAFAGSQNLNLGTGPVTMTASCQITTTNNTLTVGGNISGAAVTLTKAGAGTLKLNGTASSYTGGTVVQNGLLVLGANNALGSKNNTLDANGGTLDLNGFSLAVSNFNGTAGTILNNAGSGQAVFSITNDTGSVGVFSGLITDNSTGAGTVAVAKAGRGTMIFSSSNSYSGPTTINSTTALGSLFVVADPNALGRTNGVTGEITEQDNNNCVLLSNNVVVVNKTINIQGSGGGSSGGNGNGSLQGAAGQTNVWAGIVRTGADTTAGRFGVRQGAAGLLVVSGSIRDGLTATGGGLNVVANCDTATSIVMFSAPAGVSTYTGETDVGRGVLKLGATNTIPITTVLNVGSAGSASAAFDLNGFDQTVGGLMKSGANPSTITNSAATTNTLTINQNTNTTYSGTVSGANVNLVKSGSGVLTLTGNSSAFGGEMIVSGGTLLVNNTTGTGTGNGAVLVNGGTLSGVGIIGGAVTNQSGGTLSPGTNGIGTLTINNTLTLAAGSTTSVQVDQTSATADLVTGLSTVTYGGTLVVTNLTGTLTTSDTFTLFSASTHVGNFSSIAGSPGAGLAWSFTNGVLSVVTAASYATYPTNLMASVSGSTLTLAWPTTHLGWILQAQTNALSVGLTTPTNTWFDVAGSSASNTNVININAANPTVFYRLRLP